MPYGNVDDRAPWMPKLRNASWACRGVVFSAALPYCSGGLTDGVLLPDFERDLLYGRDGKRGFHEAIERRFIHRAGDLCDRCLAALRDTGTAPPAEGYYLHDYLEHNPSKAEVERRKQANRDKQRAKRDRDRQPVLAWEKPDVTGESPPHVTTGVEGEGTSSDEGQQENHAAAYAGDELPPGVTGEVIAILRRQPRFGPVSALTYETGIESAIAAHPGKDPVKAAHEAVATAADPAFNMTNPLRVLLMCLRKQEPGTADAKDLTGQNEAQKAGGLCVRCHEKPRAPFSGPYCDDCVAAVA